MQVLANIVGMDLQNVNFAVVYPNQRLTTNTLRACVFFHKINAFFKKDAHSGYVSGLIDWMTEEI